MTDQAEALRRMVAESGRAATRSLRLVAVVGGDGSVGTTTIAYGMAHGLTQRNERVVLADVTPSNDIVARAGLSIPLPDDARESWHQRVNLCDLLQPGPEGMLILPSPRDASGKHHTVATRQAKRWSDHLADLAPVTDWLIADVGQPSNARDWLPLLSGADEICLVTTVESNSVFDAYGMIKTVVHRHGRRRFSLLVNRCADLSQATEVHRRMAHSCQRFLGVHLYWGGRVGHDPDLTTEVPAAPLQAQSATTAAIQDWIAGCLRRSQGVAVS